MNLQESIRRILREETKLPSFIRRRYSEEDIDELISNVKFSIPKYGDDKRIDDVIHDEVREFMMDKSDFGYHGTLRNDLTGNEYYLQLSKFEEPLRDYVKSVILNTNLQESMDRSLQGKLEQVIKSKGFVTGSKAVGGIKNLSKIFHLEPHEMITDYFQNNVMSTSDDRVIDYSGGYEFKFKLAYVEKMGDAHLFFYEVSDGSVELFNGETYDLSGDEIRTENFFWWEIQQEISDILYRYTNNLIKDLNMEGDILVDYTIL